MAHHFFGGVDGQLHGLAPGGWRGFEYRHGARDGSKAGWSMALIRVGQGLMVWRALAWPADRQWRTV